MTTTYTPLSPANSPKLDTMTWQESLHIFDGSPETIEVWIATGTSQCIRWAGYVEPFESLYVRFPDDAHYRYFGVTPSHWHALVAADSPGAYFNAFIRNAHSYETVSSAASAGYADDEAECLICGGNAVSATDLRCDEHREEYEDHDADDSFRDDEDERHYDAGYDPYC